MNGWEPLDRVHARIAGDWKIWAAAYGWMTAVSIVFFVFTGSLAMLALAAACFAVQMLSIRIVRYYATQKTGYTITWTPAPSSEGRAA